MSNFSSLELDQPIEKSYVINSLRQPIWIALLTSVIIHTVLGVNLPKLSLFSKKAKLPPTVGFVELTPEQLERLPQPEEPEITFSEMPVPENFSPVAPPTPSEVPFVAEPPSSELPTIPLDPSDYNLPELPPLDPTNLSSPLPSVSTPSVSRLPKNSLPSEFSYNSPIPSVAPLPIAPRYQPTPPNTIPPLIPTFQPKPKPPQIPEQNQINEYQIRQNLKLTDDVYESGLSRRPTLEIDPTNGTSVNGTSVGENSTKKSYLDGLQKPPRRYQDKVENQQDKVKNQNAMNNKEEDDTNNVQPLKTPLPPDPTKKNRLREAPIVTQLREGKTIKEIVQETQKEKVVATPKLSKAPKSEPVALTPKPSPTPEKAEEPKKDLPSNNFEQLQQQKVTDASPLLQPQPEFKGSLLQKLRQKKLTNATVNEESQSRETSVDAALAYANWAIELGVGKEISTHAKAIPDIYPEAACEQKLEGKALVGVLVDPDGSISKGPKLLIESGFPILDNAALDAVSKESFDSSNKPKLYRYEFDFDSSNCTS